MGMKILVVDDSPTMRSLAESSLRQKGYEVMLAEDMEKGLQIVKYSKLSLIFLDYSLPNIDCGAMCRRLKTEEESKGTPLVVLLTSAEMNRREELEGCGADGFIVKPFTARELIGKVEQLTVGKDSQDIPAEQKEKPGEISKLEKQPTSDKIELDATLIDMSHKPKLTEEDKFEETSVSLELDSIQLGTQHMQENTVSADSLSDSSKIQIPSGSDLSHDYNWFVSEIKKEIKETKDENKSEREIISEDSSVDFMSKINLEDEPRASLDMKSPPTDDEFERFVSDFKREIEGVTVGSGGFDAGVGKEGRPVEKAKGNLPQKGLDYEKLVNQIVERLSEKIAQKLAEKLDRDFLRQIIDEYLKES